MGKHNHSSWDPQIPAAHANIGRYKDEEVTINPSGHVEHGNLDVWYVLPSVGQTGHHPYMRIHLAGISCMTDWPLSGQTMLYPKYPRIIQS